MFHQGSCGSDVEDAHVEFQWVLLEIDCMEEMYKSSTKVTKAFVANVVAAWPRFQIFNGVHPNVIKLC